MNVILKSRKGTHFATGLYEQKKLIVLKGSKINMLLDFEKMPQSIIALREDRKVVDQNGVLLKDIEFNSPSAAANFVTGRSVNGYIAWRVDDRVSLKEFLKR